MATMTAPPAPPSPAGDVLRHPSVYANLMPDEVVAARDARRLKHRIVLVLTGLFVLLVLVYFASVIQTQRAKSDLSSAKAQAASLRKLQAQYGPLVAAQTQAKSISKELAMLMRGDMQWKPLLQQLRKAPSGVTPLSATVNLTVGSTSSSSSTSVQNTAGYNVLNRTGKQGIGTVTITGVATDKAAIATYVDFLSNVKGFAAPFPANVSQSGGKYTFSISVIPTTDLLGGRYTSTQGGK